MPFEVIRLFARDTHGDPVDALLDQYCAEATAVPPHKEYYIGDPEYDWQTLNTSAGFRDAIVRLGTGGKYASITIHWNLADHLHELSSNGKAWVMSAGTGMRFPVTLNNPAPPAHPSLYVAIRFGDLTRSASVQATQRGRA